MCSTGSDHLVIQKLNAEGRLEKKESKKGGGLFDKITKSKLLRMNSSKVGNFCNDEDDASFWSCWIKPDATFQAKVL
ncbi:DNA helicase [Trifolium repens]|nr:DNA helicase [Trifolium repens]